MKCCLNCKHGVRRGNAYLCYHEKATTFIHTKDYECKRWEGEEDDTN